MLIPGVDLSQVVDGWTLSDLWQFYTINVKYLGNLTHEEFVEKYPNGAREIERASKQLAKLEKLINSFEND